MVKHEEGAEKGAESRRESERWRGEWVDSEEWQERPEGDPHQSVWCFKVRSTRSETGLLTGKFLALI